MPGSQQDVTRRRGLAGLMLLSGVALLLPPRWTNPLKHVAQLLVPPQDFFFSTGHRLSRSMSNEEGARPASADSASDGLGTAALAAELRQLQDENARLRALRDGGLSPEVPLLPARIVAWDVAAGRDSLLVARGSTRGVTSHDWAASRLLIDQGLASGLAAGQVALGPQSLIGRVELVSPYMARIQLFCDVDAPRLEVRIGSLVGGRLEFVDYPCSLRGAGNGAMLIEGVEYRYVEGAVPAEGGRRRIRVGDLVFSAPGQLGLRAPVLVGRVTSTSENPRKRLVYDVHVEPIARLDELREVYIIPLVPVIPGQVP